MDSSSSSQQNQYPYPPSQPPYNPSRFQSYYSNYQYQQDPNQLQQQQMYHHQQHQQQQYHHQQQYSSYYPPNYSNSYPPQTHQQWNHQEPPIHPPGVSIQPSSAIHGQAHFHLPNQQSGYHLPQRTDGVGLGINPVVALAQLNQLAGSLGAAERPTGGLLGQSWYPQAQGLGPVIGGPGAYTGTGLGSGAFPGNGAGPSGLRSHAGQSLDKGGGRRGGGQSKGRDRRGGDRRRGGSQSKGGDRRRGDGQSKGGDRRGDGQRKGGDRRRGDGQSKGGDRRSDGQSKGGDRRRADGQSRGGDRRRGKVSNSAGVGRCGLCNINCGCLGILRVHLNGKRHKRNLEKLEASEHRTLADLENVQKPSVDLLPETDMKPDNLLLEEETKQNPPQNSPLTDMKADNLLVAEETKQNPPQNIPLTDMKPDDLFVEEQSKQNPPQNIPLDTVAFENKLETEQKIGNAQQADPPNEANQDLLEKKPMMNQSGNQKSGVKRKTIVGGRKKQKVSKAKRLAFEPSNSEVVNPLMCDLCNVQCGTRASLRQHLLGRQHMSTLNRFGGHHPIYSQAGLQAIYPPNPVTNSLYHSQCPQQVLNGGQVSDPLAGASHLPQNENAAPSATGGQ